MDGLFIYLYLSIFIAKGVNPTSVTRQIHVYVYTYIYIYMILCIHLFLIVCGPSCQQAPKVPQGICTHLYRYLYYLFIYIFGDTKCQMHQRCQRHWCHKAYVHIYTYIYVYIYIYTHIYFTAN